MEGKGPQFIFESWRKCRRGKDIILSGIIKRID